MPTSPRLGHGITLPANVANVPWQSHYDHLFDAATCLGDVRGRSQRHAKGWLDGRRREPLWRRFKRLSRAPKACSHAALARIDRLAELYNNATKEHTPSYNTPGKWGIFARGGQRDYKGTKTTFIRDVLCQRHHLKHADNPSEKRKKLTVCEIGFMAGMSSMLFMESLPHARYLGFDLGNYAGRGPRRAYYGRPTVSSALAASSLAARARRFRRTTRCTRSCRATLSMLTAPRATIRS